MKTQMASVASQIDANQEEMESAVNAFQEKMDAWIAEMTYDRRERTAGQETMEAFMGKEPNPVQIESGLEHPEVPKEETVVNPIGALKNGHRAGM
jgi:hypothetical protein